MASKVDARGGLTPRKRLFVAELLSDPERNATAAAKRAGYSENRAAITACELMKETKIKDAIANKLTARAEKLDITTELQILKCEEVITRCTESGSGAWQESNCLKAIELQCRLAGLLSDKIEVGFDEKFIQVLQEGRERARRNAIAGQVVAALPEAEAVVVDEQEADGEPQQ